MSIFFISIFWVYVTVGPRRSRLSLGQILATCLVITPPCTDSRMIRDCPDSAARTDTVPAAVGRYGAVYLAGRNPRSDWSLLVRKQMPGPYLIPRPYWYTAIHRYTDCVGWYFYTYKVYKTVSSLPDTLNFRIKFCHSTGIARSGGGVRASTTSYA